MTTKFWMWIFVGIGIIVTIITLFIHCLGSTKTCSKLNESCENDKNCCTNLYCGSGPNGYKCINCKTENQPCSKQSDCCNTLHCNNLSSGYDGTCEKCESVIGNSCGTDIRCCDSLVCDSNNTCSNCVANGSPCHPNSQCCDSLTCKKHDLGSTCSDCKDNGKECTTSLDCCIGSCVDSKCSDSCPKQCTDTNKCCISQYCNTGNNCVDCLNNGDACTLSEDCCNTFFCKDKTCTKNKISDAMGSFLIYNTDFTKYLTVTNGKISWLQNTDDVSWIKPPIPQVFFFWSSDYYKTQENILYFGVEVNSNSGSTRYYFNTPNEGDPIVLLEQTVHQTTQDIKIQTDGTITNANGNLYLSENLTWTTNKFYFNIVQPVGGDIGSSCTSDDNCSVPYTSCSNEGKCVPCYSQKRVASCNTGFTNTCLPNSIDVNSYKWECTLTDPICGPVDVQCDIDKMLSCDPDSRKWHCIDYNTPCTILPPSGFICQPDTKFQPVCSPNTGGKWVCQSFCPPSSTVTCQQDYVAACYADATGIYDWRCIPTSTDGCASVPFPPNCMNNDAKTFYDTQELCERKCPNDMNIDDLKLYLSQKGSPIAVVQVSI